MYAFHLVALSSLAISALSHAGQPAIPELWQEYFGDSADARWVALLRDDGRVSAAETIAASYTLGSHHDGDRQLRTALLLATMEDDPIPTLQGILLESEPHRRAFGVLVAGYLADTRLKDDIDRLKKDREPLNVWFWDTVGDAASEASQTYEDGGIFKKRDEFPGFPSPRWRRGKIEQSDAANPCPCGTSVTEAACAPSAPEASRDT